MPTVEHRINFDDAFQGIKAHVKRHKVAYSVGGVVVVAGVAYYVGTRVGSSRTLSPSIFGINNKLDQSVVVLVERSGPPSYRIFCIETGEEVNSQGAMALLHKIRESDLRRHLNGELEHVKNKHYIRKGLAAAA